MNSVRVASATDLDQLLPLYIELHEFTAAGVPSRLRIAEAYDDQAMHQYATILFEDPSAVCLVAGDGDRLVGLAEVHLVEPEKDPGVAPTRRAHLQSLLVTEARRGEGIGSQLLAAAEEWARSKGAKEMDLDHWVFEGDPGSFYEGAGYVLLSKTLARPI